MFVQDMSYARAAQLKGDFELIGVACRQYEHCPSPCVLTYNPLL